MNQRGRRSVKALLRQKCERTLRALNRDDERALLNEVCCLAEACEQIREALTTEPRREDRMKFGDQVRDTITGFTGIATGRTEYMTGCVQVLVQPQCVDKNDAYPAAAWLDEDRLEVVAESAATLQKQEHDGPDIPAPVR